jgi:hypothetical protein
MSHVVPMGSDGAIYIRIMTLGPDIEVVLLRLLPEQYEVLRCWYY